MKKLNTEKSCNKALLRQGGGYDPLSITYFEDPLLCLLYKYGNIIIRRKDR